MLSPKYKLWHLLPFAVKYARLRLTRRPVLVNFEVTMRCNAACGGCDYWKTPATERANELASFVEAARAFDPMMITFTGGEPTLRRDLEELVAEVARAVPFCYITLLTHGGMLSIERAQRLWDAGLDSFNISLDFLDERHDTQRGIPGLVAKILALVPEMRSRGMAVRFNTVIRDDNLDAILPIVQHAHARGAGVNLSVYTDMKNGSKDHLIRGEQYARIEALVGDLLTFKRRHRGVITNSDWYLAQLPRYLRNEMPEPCRSGETTIHINPQGIVRRCPDFPADKHWREYNGYAPINCNACYYACRGEAQAPLALSRFQDLIA
ncbi:MAG: radical SAM protein [Gemmatimonadetes bacterium]|nr:radical SAM protein [Gemmatimonadota bacterium]